MLKDMQHQIQNSKFKITFQVTESLQVTKFKSFVDFNVMVFLTYKYKYINLDNFFSVSKFLFFCFLFYFLLKKYYFACLFVTLLEYNEEVQIRVDVLFKL